MEEDLITRLRADAGIIATVGTVNSRPAVDWIERSETLPALTLHDISPGKIYAHDGATGLTNPVVQFDCWGNTYGEAKLLARAVIAEMESAATVGGTVFDNSFLVTSRAMEPEDLGGGLTIFRISLDFSIWHKPV